MPDIPEQLDRLKAALADRYRLERELGRGGMATVYLAEVALKVLHPELASALGWERFLREIEVTAALNHPHILPLLDSGEAAGFLYYVMPYVEGESLRERLGRENQLPIEEAVRLTCDVARALSYAHSLGLVHRDVKPENILIHHGEAVLADFGIVRAVSVAGTSQLTQSGLALGTPYYMSPEQASAAETIDGRSDIYSLACVLYETLVGQPPFRGPDVQTVIACHVAQDVPSIRAIREQVPDYVEHAVISALAKTPADRFGTATEFAEALIGKSIEHEYRVVSQIAREAAPAFNSTVEQVVSKTKGVAPHGSIRATRTWRYGIAGSVLLLLATAGSGLFVAVRRAERVRAERLAAADSLVSLGSDYLRQKGYAEAERHLRRALEIRERDLGSNDTVVAATINDLGILFWVQREFVKAKPLFDSSIAIMERVLGPDHPRLALSLKNLGALYFMGEKYKDAEIVYERARTISEKTLGPIHLDLASIDHNLGEVYLAQGEYSDAEGFFRGSLAIKEEVLGDDDPSVAASLNGLANVYRDQGRYEESEPLYHRALTIRQSALEGDDPAIVETLLDYAGMLRKVNRVNEAAELEAMAAVVEAWRADASSN